MLTRVTSEVGQLRRVIVHRPGVELTRLTPSNKDELLFDDVLWVERSQEEHDEFAAALTAAGAEVMHFDELLRTTLANTEARRYILDTIFDEHIFGPALAESLHDSLTGMPVSELYDVLVGGLTKDECLDRMPMPQSVVLGLTHSDDFIIKPLTNHLFTRDASCWIGGGVNENSMRHVVRRRESVHYQAIYRWHPDFAGADFKVWSEGIESGLATMEGGDVLVPSADCLLIGLSERTVPQAVERLALRLFAEGEIRRIVAVRLPRKRAFMHLDTVLTMSDRETFMKFEGLGEPDTFTIEPGDRKTPLRITSNEGSFAKVLADALELPSVRMLTTAQDRFAAERDQWNDGCNLLAVRPGVVVAYERNTASIDHLRANGIEVIPVPGSELGRGRGGPRCMSCPVEREELS